MSQQINLLNPQLIQRKDQLNARNLLIALVVTVLLMGAYATWSSYRMNQLMAEQRTVDAELAALKGRLNESMLRHAQRPPSPALLQLVATTEGSLNSRQQLLDFLEGGGFGAVQGFSGFMQAFARKTTQGLWLTGFSIDEAEHQIQISGRSLQPDLVPKYISQLGQEPLFKGREFSTLSMTAGLSQPQTEAKPAGKALPPPQPYVEFRLQSVDPKAVLVQEKKS